MNNGKWVFKLLNKNNYISIKKVMVTPKISKTPLSLIHQTHMSKFNLNITINILSLLFYIVSIQIQIQL